MNLISLYIAKRKKIKTILENTKIQCCACNGNGYAKNDSENVTLIGREVLVPFYYSPTYSYMFIDEGFDILRKKCTLCNGKGELLAIDADLNHDQIVELIKIFDERLYKKRKKKERIINCNRTWNRKNIQGDPRFR